VSDEPMATNFILKKTTKFYQRRLSIIISVYVSYFSLLYGSKWKEFFPDKELRKLPSFDGRVICYTSAKIVRDYLAWRQVDCKFLSFKSGKTEREAQEFLKGTQAKDKNELLFQQFGVNYAELPAVFRKGSCVYFDQVEEMVKIDKNGNDVKRLQKKVTAEHFDVISPELWIKHPYILKKSN
ncbi:tRNA(His) guanylyltransferase protein, partial [Dioscorea alata]